jgi:hypothetical protein
MALLYSPLLIFAKASESIIEISCDTFSAQMFLQWMWGNYRRTEHRRLAKYQPGGLALSGQSRVGKCRHGVASSSGQAEGQALLRPRKEVCNHERGTALMTAATSVWIDRE